MSEPFEEQLKKMIPSQEETITCTHKFVGTTFDQGSTQEYTSTGDKKNNYGQGIIIYCQKCGLIKHTITNTKEKEVKT